MNQNIKKNGMINYTYIESDNGVDKLLSHFKDNQIDIIAVDLECDSNQHTYGEKVCLIQIYDNVNFYLIDPIKISDEQFKKLFENTNLIKIFYDAIYDSLILYKQYKINIQAVYDIKLLVDILELESRGLDTVTKKLLNIDILDKKKYQFYDWNRRPISENAIQYALNDVKNLYKLKDELWKMIKEGNKHEELIFKIISKNTIYEKNNKPGVLRSKKYNLLRRNEKEKFIEIFYVRDEIAKNIDLAPELVIKNQNLFELVEKKIFINELQFNDNINSKTKDLIHNKLSEKLKDY